MKSFNSADKALVFSFVAFSSSLVISVFYPKNIFAEALLFVSEASLVGGIADWFAVTALFEKPLGFPYHTAVLPRGREKFIASFASFAQKEFFRRDKLTEIIKGLGLKKRTLSFLLDEETRKTITERLWQSTKESVRKLDRAKLKAKLAEELSDAINAIETEKLTARFVGYLRTSDFTEHILLDLAENIRPMADDPAVLSFVAGKLRQQAHESSRGLFQSALRRAGELMNIVDYDEAAASLCRRIDALADELAAENSPLRLEIANAVTKETEKIAESEEAANIICLARERLLASEVIRDFISRLVDDFLFALEDGEGLIDESNANIPVIGAAFKSAIERETKSVLEDLSQDEDDDALTVLINDLAQHSATSARAIIAETIKKTLESMSAEKLNELVRGKIEGELIWIRLNGSIVGAVVGALAFVLTKIFA